VLAGCGAAVRPNPKPNPNPNPNPNPGPTEVATSAPCRARLVGADGARGTNEACVAELSDSSLLLNARDLSSIAGGGPTRLLQRSADGGASWSEPWRSPSLVQPASHRGCHGSMAAAAGGKPNPNPNPNSNPIPIPIPSPTPTPKP